MQSVLDFSPKRVDPAHSSSSGPELYSPTSNVSLSPATDRQPRSLNTKRKHADADSSGEPASKTRRLNPEDDPQPSVAGPSSPSHTLPQEERLRRDPTRAGSLTTIVCLHAAVAQKSYGSEKRFLCPPPCVRITGFPSQMMHQSLSMTIMAETGERASSETLRFDNTLATSFKHLHVGNSSRAKHFNLSLEIADPFVLPSQMQSTSPDEPRRLASRNRVWAQFDSAAVTIISKPSKKTAKTRNITSCILAGGPVSLFNRINAQTVRTKYLTVDAGALAASNNHWSAFTVTVLRRPPSEGPHIGGPEPVVYGSEIDLTDQQTGFTTGRLIIRKVDKTRVLADDGGPVSQMQKVALQRINADGTRTYLSAAGPQQQPSSSNGQSMTVSSTAGTVSTSLPMHSSTVTGTHALNFVTPRLKDETLNGQPVQVDEVDDFVCWTIVGISKFQYTFFDAHNRNAPPTELITPFPTLITTPTFRPTTNTLEVTVSNFFYKNSKTDVSAPLEVWLGNIGPLRHRIYHALQSTPTFSMQSAAAGLSAPDAGVTAMAPPADTTATASGSTTQNRTSNTVVIVDMPAVSEIIARIRNAMPAEPRIDEDEDAIGSPASPSSPSPPPRPHMRALEPLLAHGLPIFFIRPTDGTGYSVGHNVACENIFQTLNIGGERAINQAWIAAERAAQTDGSTHGWTLRVV
ncbi:hypothetical protein BKA62DRAFT_692650 [Auriculariales sp. MPI-PUGE-AT-0066]|nr:hypothetical protein BKA62DRAFT_692650 [Auriculariales sp. MPI-PUGE-AT-0066]